MRERLNEICANPESLDPDEISGLILAGADFRDVRIEDEPLIYWAAMNGHAELVKILIEEGADFQNVLLVGSGATISKRDHNTPLLHWAAEHGHTEVAKALIEKDADVNARGPFGCTPLHLAAMHGYTEIVKDLIRHMTPKAINAKNWIGNTALDCAAMNGYNDVVKAIEDASSVSFNGVSRYIQQKIPCPFWSGGFFIAFASASHHLQML